jgi:[acyl-carrier-protein] S-malonyltransferase
MWNIAYIFPGQGSQAVGMGKDLFDNFQASREVFEEADDALGFKLSEMCFGGSESDLQLTENTQPAILTVSIAAVRAAESQGLPTASVAAGHSLGEYSALVAAGVLEFDEAVRTVRERGRFMQEAVPVGEGAMAAILGLAAEDVARVCEDAAQAQTCSPANINSPSQVVIAGNASAVDRACELAKAAGAKRAIKLNVSAPFHCALMRPAEERLAPLVGSLAYGEYAWPVVHNVDAEASTDAAQAAGKLVRQVSSPVLWLQSVRRMADAGVGTCIEIGPGKVLSGLSRQIEREIKCHNIEDAVSLRTTLESL